MPHKARASFCVVAGMLLLPGSIAGAETVTAAHGLHPGRPVAVDGIVSLTQRDLSSSVPLAGEWELYKGLLLGPEDFSADHENPPRTLVSVPGGLERRRRRLSALRVRDIPAGHPSSARGS